MRVSTEDSETGRQEEKTNEYLVFNERNQPVELYFSSQLIVLPPLGRVALSEDELATPQIRILRQRRHITIGKIEEMEASEAEKMKQVEDADNVELVKEDKEAEEEYFEETEEKSTGKGKRKRSGT
jgi:hypothetical protein